jgi:membrane protein
MLYGYTEFQFGLSRYNVIYSSFASIPFFMVWLYSSWLMLIVGAVTAYIHQNYSHLRENAMTAYVSYSYKERLALRAFMAIASAFYEGKKPLSIERLSTLLDVPVHLVHDMIFILRDEELISVISGEDSKEMHFLPSKDLSRIRFTEVLIALREHGENPSEQMTEGERSFLDTTLDQILKDVEVTFKDITFDDLCREYAGRYLLEMKSRTKEKNDFFSRFF